MNCTADKSTTAGAPTINTAGKEDDAYSTANILGSSSQGGEFTSEPKQTEAINFASVE